MRMALDWQMRISRMRWIPLCLEDTTQQPVVSVICQMLYCIWKCLMNIFCAYIVMLITVYIFPILFFLFNYWFVAVAWCLYNLATHPEYQAKCHDEVDSVLEGKEHFAWSVFILSILFILFFLSNWVLSKSMSSPGRTCLVFHSWQCASRKVYGNTHQ